MKKLISSLILFLVFSTVISAASLYGEYKSNPIVKVTYNGDEVKPVNVPGINLKGTTMIPLNMLRQMGFNVSWDNATKTVDVSSNEPSVPVKERSDDANRRVLTEAEIQALDKAVAYIEILYDDGQYYHGGSGFVINPKGLLITNFHVAEVEGKLRAMRVEVNGQIYEVPSGKYLFADKENDVYGVYLGGESFPYLMVNTTLPQKDDVVYALGNPEGIKNILTVGKVEFIHKGEIFTNAITKPGSSGGALLNEYGEVVGITQGGGETLKASISMMEVKRLHEQSFNQ